MLPALASLEDLGARIEGGIDSEDEARARALLEDASTIVRKAAGATWVDDEQELVESIPDIVITITCAAAKRAFENPKGVSSEGAGPFNTSYAGVQAELVWLTATEKAQLSDVGGTKSGLWTMRTSRGDLETRGCHSGLYPDYPDGWTQVDPAGTPLPISADDTGY